MDDEQWKRMIAECEDVVELLDHLIDLDDRVSGIGDPYYKDLYEAVFDRLRELKKHLRG